MTATSAVARGRIAAEALMVDTCTIRRLTGEAMDATTLVMEPTYATIYAGRCRVQLADVFAQTPQAGERAQVVTRTLLQIPASVTGVLVDDVATVTASELDGDLVGREFRVASEFHKTHATARRLECEETQS